MYSTIKTYVILLMMRDECVKTQIMIWKNKTKAFKTEFSRSFLNF